MKEDQFLEVTKADGSSRFPVESGRYLLYVATGCPYAARPFMILKLLGLDEHIKVIRTFPGNGEDSWFFVPVSDWEKKAVAGQKTNEAIWWDEKEPMHNFT